MEYIKLEEVCEKATSNISQKDLEDNFGEYPIYGASGLIKNIDFYKQEKEYIAIVKDGAGIGRTMLLPAKSSVIGTLQYIVPNDKIDIKYLYYAITSMKLSKYFSGATIPHIYFKDYKREKIPFVTRKNQKKISSILSKIEKIIEEKKEQLELLENLKKSQFFELFGDPIKNEKGWENYKLNEIYEIIDGDRGKNYPKSSDFSNKGFCLFLNAKNVTKEGFKFEETNYISQEKDKSMGKGKLERGDIVLTTRGTLGNLAIYGEKIKYPNIRINSGMVILRKIDKTLEDKYFIEYLKNSRIIEKIKSGTAQPQIPILHLKKIKISVPPIILQNKFATKIEAIQKLKFEIEKSLKETENLYNSLMQKFFSNK